MRGSRLALAGVLVAATALAGSALLGVSGWLLSRAAEHPAASALTVGAVAVRALGISRGLLRYAERLAGHDAVLRDAAARRAALFAAVRRRPGATTGSAVSALVRDVEGAQDVWLRGVLPLAGAAVVGLVTVACAALLLPAAALVLVAGLGLAVVAVPVLGWWAAADEEQRGAAQAEHQSAVTDLLHGAADLVTLRGASEVAAAVAGAGARLARIERRTARRSSLLAAAVPLLQGLTVVAVLGLASAAVRDGDLARVDAAAVVLLAWAGFEPGAALVDAVVAVRRGRAALRRWAPAVDVAGGSDVPTGPLVVSGAALTYPGRTRPAVHGVTLVLQPGDRLGVVGGSGAGKSTLLALLAGALPPTVGSVTVGGQPLHALDETARAASVAVAEQDAHVFDASVRDNLRLADPSADDDRLLHALDVVGLRPWLAGLPEGLGTVLGHRGARMSGGQRRRLTVARALLSPAPLLLLDEPTEGLSPDEADELVGRVLAECSDRGLVVVSHRPDVWWRLDALLVLEAGQVTAQGAPADVLAGSDLVAAAARLQPEPEGAAA